ncbi:MAG TPA: hypothetical protein VGN90_02560 [Pyrinomonadaceae bacterium]|nr:hypothetical protein [Pyrinomonadaceae bacterium]
MKIVRLSSLFFAFLLVASACLLEFPVLAGSVSQNSNSSTTAVENTNTAKPGRVHGRRHARKTAASTEGTATPSTELIASASSIDKTEQTDLSGTYTGTFDCADAGVSGESTLTITGNQFTLPDGKTGRIVASTTRGYTGVAMQFGESTAVTGNQPATMPTIVSMRARKAGDRLTLIPVAGSGHVCSFTPTGSSRSTRSRRTRVQTAPPAEAAMPVAPAEPMPVAPAEPMSTPTAPPEPATPAVDAGPAPPTTPASGRRGRRGRRGSPTSTNPAAPAPTPVPPS